MYRQWVLACWALTQYSALNGAAELGGFAHNTGEGGISPTIKPKGRNYLIYQVGTGYFGSRSKDGKFSPEEFAKRANLPQVKMIELKLSQGAKPGHGGILPAKKTPPKLPKYAVLSHTPKCYRRLTTSAF